MTGDEVRELRGQLGITQRQLATCLEMPRSVVSLIEGFGRFLEEDERLLLELFAKTREEKLASVQGGATARGPMKTFSNIRKPDGNMGPEPFVTAGQ